MKKLNYSRILLYLAIFFGTAAFLTLIALFRLKEPKPNRYAPNQRITEHKTLT